MNNYISMFRVSFPWRTNISRWALQFDDTFQQMLPFYHFNLMLQLETTNNLHFSFT